MSTPIVLAHLEGDDAAGVRLAACTGCGGTLVRAAATCDRCRLPPTRARVMAVLRGALAPMRPRDVVQATGLPSRAGRAGTPLQPAPRHPRGQWPVRGGVVSAPTCHRTTDPSPASSKIRGIR